MGRQERRNEIAKRLSFGESLEAIYADYPELSVAEKEADIRFFLRTNIITGEDIKIETGEGIKTPEENEGKQASPEEPIVVKEDDEEPTEEPEGLTSEEIQQYILENYKSLTNLQMGKDLGVNIEVIAGERRKLLGQGLIKSRQELIDERREERRKRSKQLIGKIKVPCIAARLGIYPDTVYKILGIGTRSQIEKKELDPTDPTLKMTAEELENAGKRVMELCKRKEYREALDVVDDILLFGNMKETKLVILEAIRETIEDQVSKKGKDPKKGLEETSREESDSPTEFEWIDGEDR